jgi:hypothetical protein
MKRQAKHPEDMSAAELVEATKEFDQPYAFEKDRLMTSAELAQERKLRRGRPKIGKGAKKISISLESDLLKQADVMAKKKGMNCSELITGFVIAGLGALR